MNFKTFYQKNKKILQLSGGVFVVAVVLFVSFANTTLFQGSVGNVKNGLKTASQPTNQTQTTTQTQTSGTIPPDILHGSSSDTIPGTIFNPDIVPQANTIPNLLDSDPHVVCKAGESTVSVGQPVHWQAIIKNAQATAETQYTWLLDAAGGSILSGSLSNSAEKTRTYSTAGEKQAKVEVKLHSDDFVSMTSEICVVNVVQEGQEQNNQNQENGDQDQSNEPDSSVDQNSDQNQNDQNDQNSGNQSSQNNQSNQSNSSNQESDQEASTVNTAQNTNQNNTNPATPQNTQNNQSQTTTEQLLAGKPSQCPEVSYPKDIDNHWAKDFIKKGVDLCLLSGYPDGSFKPDQPVTRSEAVKMAMAAGELTPHQACRDSHCGANYQVKIWQDITALWQGQWIRAARDINIVEGYADGTFRPNDLITRAEAASLITKTPAFQLKAFEGCYTPNCGAGHPDNLFSDIQAMWQGKYVRSLWDAGLIQGTSPNAFEPNRPITRAEMTKIVIKARELME